jgi:ADP-heptose:LPS heptosyltransferase
LEKSPPRHILIARTDKVGDLLLSLPTFQALKKAFPHTRLTALVSPYAKEIVQSHPAVDAVELYEKGEGFWGLAQRLKALKPDVFIALYPRPQQVLAAWMAGIPTRIGTAYRWYSFLLTDKIKVHRSACDRHEAEYNLDLVEPLGVKAGIRKIEFPLTEAERSFARDLLRERGIKPKDHYVVVHPGHKGSALNWKPERYGQITGQLCRQKGLRVVLTGAADETELISQVTTHLSGLGPNQKPILLIGECTLRQLAAVYEGADCFLSGSTGTMHLAAAVGTSTVALFCPIPQTTPVRWGPWGNKSTVLMPRNLECPNCRVGTCSKHDPMDAISVEEVLAAMKKYLPKKAAR